MKYYNAQFRKRFASMGLLALAAYSMAGQAAQGSCGIYVRDNVNGNPDTAQVKEVYFKVNPTCAQAGPSFISSCPATFTLDDGTIQSTLHATSPNGYQMVVTAELETNSYGGTDANGTAVIHVNELDPNGNWIGGEQGYGQIGGYYAVLHTLVLDKNLNYSANVMAKNFIEYTFVCEQQ